MAAFISYAFSNTIGLSLLTSGSIRYRLYSAWGVSAEKIARLVTFTTITFWIGIVMVAGLIFISEPVVIPALAHIAIHSTRMLGLLFASLVIGYMIFVSTRKRPLRLLSWELPIPSLRLAWAQLLIGSLDWILAGSVLFVLLPEQSGLSFMQFLGIYLLAQVVALISHVPRFLRATVGSVILLLIFTLAQLLKPSPKDPNPPGKDELTLARQIINRSPQTLPNLALLGDKELLFDDRRSGFVMYGIEGRAWVALGDRWEHPRSLGSLPGNIGKWLRDTVARQFSMKSTPPCCTSI
ncbi:MAG: hypothetical protein V2B20_05455 [Pseudomonadota bacterium]